MVRCADSKPRGLVYREDIDNFFDTFELLEDEERKDIVYKLNTSIINKGYSYELKGMYYEEFAEVYGDFGEADATEEISFLTKSKDLGSMERLRYLTLWFNAEVSKGTYSGDRV